ncbi:glycosyltransferase [Thermoactinomyces intermedius]|jgi:processive 1,2-diacylglycerol beta-glucosyltransferase|uniref:Glycosyltransferase n=1 Tax=Thermoactinomyces intermedius TaxID=2024 RepID=A0A8I1A4H9_THEIN|nr:glycosyltransferase [Thermoactinomyces intermedius]MBA4547434.1 glycosyltransferase [Thermoactinomyces intermedius]MBA4837680.1 glycosyltransferase [Thermoactinomyces intermedius]MBH8594338.1 glycosyltransferase [Thermoactinomyces intermedius]
MDKILILTETVAGYGHYSAASSLKKGIELEYPGSEVQIVSILPMISKQLKSLIKKSYLQTLRYAPNLWGACYQWDSRFSKLFRDPMGKFVAHKLRTFIEGLKPRVIICTHAFCLSACAYLKSHTSCKHFRLGGVVTDFDVHSFWVHPAVDFYITAHEEIGVKIRKKGCQADLYSTGIPINPAFFTEQKEKKEARKQIGISPDRFTILLMGGGSGIGPFYSCLEALKHMPLKQNYQLLIITGNNQPLYDELSRELKNLSHVHLFPFVHNMVDFMCASDFIVTKPGGMTSSEALATGLPMVICQPIPGQEEKNSRFLLNKQVAIREDQPQHLPKQLTYLIEHPDPLHEMQNNATLVGKPGSAIDGAQIVMDYL